MKDAELKLIITDIMAALPESLKGREIAAALATIAASYSDNKMTALQHIYDAALLIQLEDSRT